VAARWCAEGFLGWMDPAATLYFDDAVALSLTELALEHKLNDMISAGNEAMRLSRKEFWDSAG
jgi:hypothetical protein